MTGILDIENDTKARKALIWILRHRNVVFSYEWAFVDRVMRIIRRNFTVSESNKIYMIRGRMGTG